MKDHIEQVVDARRKVLFDWKELMQYGELFYFFTWRDIKIKYKQTVLGFLWAVLQPLLMMLIFTFFFGKALSVPSEDIPYPVFVLSGLLIWNIFSSGLVNAASSMVSNAAIIKKIYFPRIIIPTSNILVSLFDFLMAFLVFVGVLLYYASPVQASAFFLWPLAILIAVLATLGPGCLLAALNVKYRDFRYVIPFLVQVLFFVTPVLYPISVLDSPILKYFIAASPMYAAVTLFKLPITHGVADMELVSISVVSGLLLLVAGVYYFKKTEEYFADLA